MVSSRLIRRRTQLDIRYLISPPRPSELRLVSNLIQAAPPLVCACPLRRLLHLAPDGNGRGQVQRRITFAADDAMLMAPQASGLNSIVESDRLNVSLSHAFPAITRRISICGDMHYDMSRSA
jgi:hypothetical protein